MFYYIHVDIYGLSFYNLIMNKKIVDSDIILVNKMLKNGSSLSVIADHFGFGSKNACRSSICLAIKRLGFESFLQYRRKKR